MSLIRAGGNNLADTLRVLLFFVGHVGMREKQILGAKQAQLPEAPIATAASASDRLLMLASSSTSIPSAVTARLIAIRRPNDLSDRKTRAAIFDRPPAFPASGLTMHVPVAAVDHNRVAVFHVLQHPAHTGDGRNAAAAGQNRRMAGFAAGLRDDAAHFAVAQHHHLRGQAVRRPPESAALPSAADRG